MKAYLLSFSEDPVLEAPGDGGGGVSGSLAGQRDVFVKLGGRLVAQVGDLRRNWRSQEESAEHLWPQVRAAAERSRPSYQTR